MRTSASLTPFGRFAIGDLAAPPAPRLTPRQLEVLGWLCEGLPNKLIARRLNISAATVKVHIGSILRELGVASRLQAAIAARNRGLVSEPGAGSSAGWPGYAVHGAGGVAGTAAA